MIVWGWGDAKRAGDFELRACGGGVRGWNVSADDTIECGDVKTDALGELRPSAVGDTAEWGEVVAADSGDPNG